MKAALYLRSSKDRSDVSIDAQRRELQSLAKQRDLVITAEYADAVFSGKDEDRPGFQALLTAMRNPNRGWETLLVLDTSRIARRRHIAIFFERDADKRDITIIYKSLPDTDPVTGNLLKSILQAMDEWHSMTSRAKGLAGMAENVRQGWRAGGRAPIGYALETIETGAVRDGKPVTKSKLVPAANASDVADYLKARAQGVPRAKAGLPDVKENSKVGIEWNAMTYAGHTVWNVHAEAGSGRKRRPRKDWVTQRDTHPALITDDEAEIILTRLEAFTTSRARNRESGYLLSGLLKTPDGKPFYGDRGAYRIKGRQVQASVVDEAVTQRVMTDLQSSAFVQAITKAARGMKPKDKARGIRKRLQETEAAMTRLVGLLEQTTATDTILRRVEALEVERDGLREHLAALDAEAAQVSAVANITEMEVRRLLVERAASIADADHETLRTTLQELVDCVVLEGDGLAIHYRIASRDRNRVASPRGDEAIPVIRHHRLVA